MAQDHEATIGCRGARPSHPLVGRIGVGRVLECAASLTAVAAWAALVLRLLRQADGPSGWALLCAIGLFSWLGADAISGTVHWLADRIYSPCTPFLGAHFVAPFRRHHANPSAITRHDWVELNGNTCILALPFLAAALALPFGSGPSPELALAAGIAGLAGWLMVTNTLHRWAHEARPPRAVRWLQRHHLVLDPVAHARHHAGRHDSHYCITNGSLNPLLDRWRVFPRLEALLRGARRGRARAQARAISAPRSSSRVAVSGTKVDCSTS